MASSDVDGPLDGKRTNLIPEVGETFSVDPTPHPDEPAEVAKRVSDLELTVTGMLDRLEALEAKSGHEHHGKSTRKASA